MVSSFYWPNLVDIGADMLKKIIANDKVGRFFETRCRLALDLAYVFCN